VGYNSGFGKACNIGAKLFNSKFILFLNPDTKLLDNAISKVLDRLENINSEDIAIAGIKLVDNKNKTTKTCSYFPSLINMVCSIFGITKLYPKYTSNFIIDFSHEYTRYVDQIMGAFFLVRRDCFLDLNGFDERFFVYYEEVDFSYRAFIKNKKSIYFSEFSIFHYGGGSSSKIKAKRMFYSLRSKLIYAKLHFKKISFIFFFLIVILIEPITRFLKSFSIGQFSEIREIFLAFILLYMWILKTIINLDYRLYTNK
tara:strand:+ start:247 stop:1014 length:768 start_codon:yes stop_codon:yes gene_type:complete